MERAEITFTATPGEPWVVNLSIDMELRKRLANFCEDKRRSMKDVINDAFSVGVISEEALDLYLQSNGG